MRKGGGRGTGWFAWCGWVGGQSSIAFGRCRLFFLPRKRSESMCRCGRFCGRVCVFVWCRYTGSQLPLLLGGSWVHYFIYIGTFYQRTSINYGLFLRDAVAFKLVALANIVCVLRRGCCLVLRGPAVGPVLGPTVLNAILRLWRCAGLRPRVPGKPRRGLQLRCRRAP